MEHSHKWKMERGGGEVKTNKAHLSCQPPFGVSLDAGEHLCHHDHKLTGGGQLADIGREVLTADLRNTHGMQRLGS
jgi:hypothetical protein